MLQRWKKKFTFQCAKLLFLIRSLQQLEWIEQHSPEFVRKDEWPPNSPDLNPLDYHVWGAMLEQYKVFTPKPTKKAEFKTVLVAIWEDLPQEAIDLAVLAFRKRLQACIRADGGHFEHLLK